jgi:cobalamin synthase
MNGWIWVAIVIAVLLAIGGWTDWRRRHFGGGQGDTPGDARRDAQARHNPGGGAP